MYFCGYKSYLASLRKDITTGTLSPLNKGNLSNFEKKEHSWPTGVFLSITYFLSKNTQKKKSIKVFV